MPLRPLGNARISIDTGDGWQEVHGIRDVRLDPTYDPPDLIEGYGLGEVRGIVQTIEVQAGADETFRSWIRDLFAAELLLYEQTCRALEILAPHLDREPLYVG